MEKERPRDRIPDIVDTGALTSLSAFRMIRETHRPTDFSKKRDHAMFVTNDMLTLSMTVFVPSMVVIFFRPIPS